MSKEDVSFKTACLKKTLHNEFSIISDPISPQVPQLFFYYFTITVSFVLQKFYPIFHMEAGEEGSHAQWNNASDSTKLWPNPAVNFACWTRELQWKCTQTCAWNQPHLYCQIFHTLYKHMAFQSLVHPRVNILHINFCCLFYSSRVRTLQGWVTQAGLSVSLP